MQLEINNTTKNKINTQILQKAADIFGKKFKADNKIVSVAFVGDSEMAKINKTCRGLDKMTDVLSFAGDEGGFLGEIILCYPQIKRQAKELGEQMQDELAFIFVHGLLHLIGYDDQTKKNREQMLKIGRELCEQSFNLTD